MENEIKSTAERMKHRRKELRMSQQDLADALGVNRSTVSRYESGYIEKLPTEYLVDLAQALKTTPAYLMGWDDETFEERLINAYKHADEKTKRTVLILLDIE